MSSQRDASRSGMLIVVGALDLVVGVLLAASHWGNPFFVGIGLLLAVASLAMLAVGIQRFRRGRRQLN